MISTEPKIAQCQKCNAFVFEAQVSGIRTIVDPAPVTDAIAALAEGKCLYVGHKSATGAVRRFAPMRTLGEGLYAQHGCTVGAVVRASPVEVAPVGPQQAPVTPGGSQDGFPRHPAPVDGSQGRNEAHSQTLYQATYQASSATRPRAATRASRRLFRCEVCNQPIYGYETNIVAIHHGERIVWAEHVEH